MCRKPGMRYRKINEKGEHIYEGCIVFGTVFLDKITLKYKSLKFRICDDILKSRDMGNHLLDLRPFIPAALKILPHTVFKAYRLTYINDLIFLIMHEIHARFCGKFF